jgi:hypothetical protein
VDPVPLELSEPQLTRANTMISASSSAVSFFMSRLSSSSIFSSGIAYFDAPAHFFSHAPALHLSPECA